MLNSIQACYNYFVPALQEKITFSLSDTQKRIMLVASAAFAFLATCYLIKCTYQRIYQSDVTPLDSEDDQETPSIPFEKAMELMFQHRKLEWEEQLDPLTDEQQKARHKELKEMIQEIDEKDINKVIIYRDGMMSREQTLLLQAVMNISDADQRLEIVTLLLEKGADPLIEGFYYAPVNLMKEAELINDKQLIQILENAIKKQSQQDVE